MRHYLHIIALCTLLFVWCSCTRDNEIETGGGSNNEPAPLTVRVSSNDFTDPAASGVISTRAPFENGIQSIFSKGDAIGIFAVKDGVITNSVNNLKLTYVKTNDTSGEWNPPTGTTLYWSDGATYIAYYPYKEGITIDASKTPADIISSLAVNELLKPVTDQSDHAKYTSCDLMTAIGEVRDATGGSTRKILNLKLAHQFALLVLKPQATIQYIPPNGSESVFKYHQQVTSQPTVDVTAQNVTINGIKPCRMDDGSFRAIVPPSDKSSAISGSYTSGGTNATASVKVNYSGNNQITFTAGTYYTLTVNNPLPSITLERGLKPGDFVFVDDDIEIFPGDGAFFGDMIPNHDKAVGMIVTCDTNKMTDTECNNKGWDHAYVMGLDNIGHAAWGDPNNDESSLPEMDKNADIQNNMNGYTETEAIIHAHAANMTDYGAVDQIYKYRLQNVIPAGVTCSPWFLPSIGQWYDVLVNICGVSPKDFKNESGVGLEDHTLGTETLEKLNRQLAKVGKDMGARVNNRHIFWSSTEYSTDLAWIMIWHFEFMSNSSYYWDMVGIKGYQKNPASQGYNIRPFFAF